MIKSSVVPAEYNRGVVSGTPAPGNTVLSSLQIQSQVYSQPRKLTTTALYPKPPRSTEVQAGASIDRTYDS